MQRMIWKNPAQSHGTYVVKFMGIDATCGEAIVDFGEGEFEWLPISQLRCWDTNKPLSEMVEVPHDLVASHAEREAMLTATMRQSIEEGIFFDDDGNLTDEDGNLV